MKVAILTLPLHTNIGGILQAWALQTILEDMGHEARVLMPKRMKKEIPIDVKLKRAILKFAGKLKEDKFKKKHIKFKWVDELSTHALRGFDVIIAGSDQVWRKKYFNYAWGPTVSENAFLAFCAHCDIRKISYAASLGIENWGFTIEETNRIKEALDYFDGISVRELSAVDIVKDATMHEPEYVLDPTMLIPAEKYIELVSKEMRQSPGGIVSYILDQNTKKQGLVKAIYASKGLKHTALNRSNVSVKEWIASIAMSELVVTDSFHGCVFAIIFNRPLIFVENQERGNARFNSLIRTFQIGRNFISSLEEYNPEMEYSLPDNINDILSDLREKSRNFLTRCTNEVIIYE